MIKRISGTGTLDDMVPDLFQRNDGMTSRFRGIASFDDRWSVLLEVADTGDLRAKGLTGRTRLLECCGMIFTGLAGGGAFWMRGCVIPLDIVFLNSAGIVTRQYSMPVDSGIRRYSYTTEKTAIELAYGFCQRHDIHKGAQCVWRTWK